MTRHQSPLRNNDRRALGLLIYHALRRAVESFPEDGTPSDQQLQDILIDAISLLPGLGAAPTDRLGKVRLYQFPVGKPLPSGKPIEAQETLLDLQPIMDSLRIVWQDYLRAAFPN